MKNLLFALVAIAFVSCSKNDAVDVSKIPVRYNIKFFSSNPGANNVVVEYRGATIGKVGFVASSFDCNKTGFVTDLLFTGAYEYTRVEIVGQDTLKTPVAVVVPEYINGCLFIDVK